MADLLTLLPLKGGSSLPPSRRARGYSRDGEQVGSVTRTQEEGSWNLRPVTLHWSLGEGGVTRHIWPPASRGTTQDPWSEVLQRDR